MRSNFPWLLLNALNVLDAIGTAAFLYLGANEVNPLTAALISAGIFPFIVGKLAVVYLGSSFLRLLELHRILLALAGVYGVLVGLEGFALLRWLVGA